MSSKNWKYLKLACQLSADNKDKHYNLSCLLRRFDGSFSFARNGRTKTPEPALHAEQKVLRKSGLYSTMWIARVTKGGQIALARPCKNCQMAIKQAKVKVVYYTINNNEYGTWFPNK
jgi:tRNA(Arg) A34 adenosine deaminase TadA